ncbi:NUDT17 [Acrasis kona]|uniref:m7GpppN-mRNA hydrolase NUDT17 n=1 Tax=Acrasis kona TaxID=1008807 RepID=A0AAW2YJ57_9EUKA
MKLFLKKVGLEVKTDPALFEKSIFEYFEERGTVFNANLEVKDRKVLLSNSTTNNTMLNAPMGRSPHCPMALFNKWSEQDQQRSMDLLNSGSRKFKRVSIAVSVLLENSPTNHILLTRRGLHMRSFPGIWVLPGGGVESYDQDIFETARRELLEETGIDTSRECWSILAMWESVYPTFLHQGPPKRHHLVIYLKAKLNLFSKLDSTAFDLLKPQEEEVDAITWLNKQDLSKVLQKSDAKELLPSNKENSFLAVELKNKQPILMYLNQLQTIEAGAGDSVALSQERLSLGTVFAMKQWITQSG